jgi:hypothetical protein
MIKEMKLFFDNTYLLKFNWAKILFFLTFFTYGFFGVISKFNNEIFTLLSIFCLVFFYVLSKRFHTYFLGQFSFKNFEVFIFFIFLIILIIINIEYINLSLFGDELAHTIRASRTSIYGIITIIETLDLNFFDNFKFKNLVHFVNLLLLLLLIFVIFLIKNYFNLYTLVFIIFLTIFFRLFLKDFGMHPPLDHIFSFVLFSIVGISDFSANLSYLIGYAFFQIYLFRLINQKDSNFIVNFLSTVCIFTIPLLLSMSTWTESAIWSAMFFIIILLEIFYLDKINFLRVISIISIATLFRISIFITLLPVIIYFLSDLFNEKKINLSNLKHIFFTLSPIIIFLPFLFNSIFFGTPTFTAVTQNLENETNLSQNFSIALETDIIWITVLNSISYWWIFLILFIFFPDKNKFFLSLILVIYIIFSLLVYYSIDQAVWGLSKYASEYALPLCVLGFLNFILILKKIRINNLFIGFFLTILICLNLFDFVKTPIKNKAQDEMINTYSIDIKKLNSDVRLFNYKLVYNLKDSFSYIKSKNLDGNTYLVGTTYGFLPEILNGYKVKQILKTKKILNNQKILQSQGIELTKRVSMDSNIKAILLADVKNIDDTISNLISENWKIEKKFFNTKFRSTLYLLTPELNN